jgi:glycine hydroxymethyltransferase
MLQVRPWVPESAERYIQALVQRYDSQDADTNERELLALVQENRDIHERDCINLNPATNVMNPRAEAMLAQRLGSRPSLGYPGEKYEMGLEAIEKIEVMAAQLAARLFGASHAEIRVSSGALANLYCFMATCRPGDSMVAPPPAIGGHVTHQSEGAAGLYGLKTLAAPIDAEGYSVDVDALRRLVRQHRPRLITLGGSLNLFPHPIAKVREIADEVGAKLMFDAAHLCGVIAGRAWQQPLAEGAHAMTMSTYKSLGGPAGGLVLCNDAELAQRIESIAYPGLTANFDAAKSAALAMTLLDWQVFGQAYARAMVDTAQALAQALITRDVPVFARDRGVTQSHQFAVEAVRYGGGQTTAKRLRQANLLTCGIGLPSQEAGAVAGDLNGLRIGTPEIVRWGMGPQDMPELAGLIAQALSDERPLAGIAADVTALRGRFQSLHYMR